MREVRTLRHLLLLLASLFALLPGVPAAAQAPDRVRLFPPDIQKFPILSAGLDVRDPAGRFIPGLNKDQLTLLENGEPVPIDGLQESSTPVEISVAINPSPTMAVPTPDGRPRYTVIADALAEWAGQPSSGQLDRFNLFLNNADPSTGHSYRSEWLQAFQGQNVEPQNAKPALDSLTQALQQAAANPGSPRAVLWITSPPEGALLSALPPLVEQAQKAGIRLFIWSISPAVAFHSTSAQALEQAAGQTGGQFFPFSGPEQLPNLDDWLNPLRGRYTLQYTTHARSGGDQSLAARVQLPDGPLESTPLTFQLDLQPPNPVLLSPPASLQRTCPADCPDPSTQLGPADAALRILVEFPDKHPRALSAVRLYVDGQLAVERTEEPFNQVSWDLRGLTISGLHHLSVEAVDQLGLSRRSLETPVQVEISIARTPAWKKLAAQPGFKAGAAAAGAAVVLGVGFFSVRRYLPGLKRRWKNRRPSRASGKPQQAAGALAENEAPRRSWLHPGGKPAAQLIWVEPVGQPVPLSAGVLSLGADAARADVVLDDPTIDPLHARITSEEGGFRIFDNDSAAGTWVNFELVPGAGTRLRQDDLVHLGRLAFRFEQPGASHGRQVVVEKLEP